MKAEPSQDIYFYIIGWIMIGAFAGFLLFVKIFHLDILSLFPPCVMHLVTGFYCPGCGGTRAVNAMIHGHVLLSFFYHPFVLFTAVFGGWFMLSQSVDRISRHRIPIGMHYRNVYLWITLILIFGNWFLKNGILLFTGVAVMG